MEASEILSKAWAAVEKAGIPKELHPIAFREAVRLLEAGGDGSPRPTADRGARQAPVQAGASHRTGTTGKPKLSAAANAGVQQPEQISEDVFFERIETQTGVARDRAERLIHLDGAIPQISRPARLLGTKVGEQVAVVAQLLSVARHFGLDEAETSTKALRAECARLKINDSGNMTKYISNLDGVIYTGPKTDKQLRVRPQGIQAFATIVDKLLGDQVEPSD